jgi:uncharacterized protein (TIGR03437 family)
MGIDEPRALAVSGASAVYLAGSAGSLVFFSSGTAAQRIFGGGDTDAFAARLDLTASQPFVSCVLNAASLQAGNTSARPTGTVAPGEIVSIFGTGVGPDQAVTAQPAAGSYPVTLGGTQVFFDGVPAAMLYAGTNQINAIVPYGIASPVTQMTLQRSGFTDGPRVLPVVPAVPGIVTVNSSGTQQAAVLNQDGTYNAATNPAAIGSVIVFYAVGAGTMNPAAGDGTVAPGMLPLPAPQLPVTVQIGGLDAKVRYAGAAPGFVSGLLQVNVEVPGVAGIVPLSLSIGGQASQLNVTIATK